MFEATRQGGVFLSMMYAGLACGVFYDILRLLRRMMRAGRVASAAADLIFWLGAACVCAYALFHISHEPVRLYALLGALCGMLLYLAGVSELIYGVMGTLWREARGIAERARRRFSRKI